MTVHVMAGVSVPDARGRTRAAPPSVWRAVRARLARFASAAPARVFVLGGLDAPDDLAWLRLEDGITAVDSPRSANLLLVAGTLPGALHEAARHVHDQLAHPRRTVHWLRADEQAWVELSGTDVVVRCTDAERNAFADTVGAAAGALIARLREVHDELLTGAVASEAAILPDVDPAPWRGVGPYGQGGAGMTGGVPYGRPMAETAPDRDGLTLDRLAVRVGPFFSALPAGLVLDVRLQGDVVQDIAVGDNPFASTGLGISPHAPSSDPFRVALERPVRIAEMERARASHHLRWLAHALQVHGLDALGRRALALARALRAEGHPAACVRDVRQLIRLVERTRTATLVGAGVGVIASDRVGGRGLGPIARAAGIADDARSEDAAYRALGFAPVLENGSDVRARWRQRMAEVVQCLEMAAQAGNAESGGTGRVECPRGLCTKERSTIECGTTASVLALLPELLRGAEWGDAVATIVSLDLDLRDVGSPTRHAEHQPGSSPGEGTREASP